MTVIKQIIAGVIQPRSFYLEIFSVHGKLDCFYRLMSFLVDTKPDKAVFLYPTKVRGLSITNALTKVFMKPFSFSESLRSFVRGKAGDKKPTLFLHEIGDSRKRWHDIIRKPRVL